MFNIDIFFSSFLEGLRLCYQQKPDLDKASSLFNQVKILVEAKMSELAEFKELFLMFEVSLFYEMNKGHDNFLGFRD